MGEFVMVQVDFKCYSTSDREICLVFFDANCPEFFAPNERRDYEQFLECSPEGYEICLLKGKPVGAYGLCTADNSSAILTWVLLDPGFQRMGIGSAMILRAIKKAGTAGKRRIEINASHLSAPFFARFGAEILSETKHGWGPDLHKIEMEIILD
jgi:GNAT superfamily N-acetyltransferase